ncbi:MAG: aquaporin [Fimbriimonadaceae bacterium]|nr:aquaporin [Fimbriimonadaceae bacterium]
MKKYIVEFVGTFALCFVGILAIAHLGEVPGGLLGIALAHGLVIVAFGTSAGAISGGHLNPSVTLGFLVTKRISLADAGLYIVSQLFGAVAGAFFAGAALPSRPDIVKNGTPALGGGIPMSAGFIAEIIATFFLVWVIFGTAVEERSPKVGALMIGLTVTLDILAIGPITGAAMNPARWMGPALITGNLGDFVLYWVGPTVGAILAAVLWNGVLLSPDKEA